MRAYEEHWQQLKQLGMAEWGINVHTAFPSDVLVNKIYKRFKKAIQKEKSKDLDFRSDYPNAILIFQLIDTSESNTGKAVKAVLDKKHYSLAKLGINFKKIGEEL